MLFGCATAGFGPLSREQPHTPNVNHCHYNVNHCHLHFRPEGYREPHNEVKSQSPAEPLERFEPGIFQFLLQRLNPLGDSPHVRFGHQDKNFASKAKFQVNPKREDYWG